MEEPPETTSITHLSNDHTFSILRLLPVDSILAFSMTCTRFRTVASSNVLWESIYGRDFGSGSAQVLAASLAKDKRSALWKKIYEQISQLGSVFCMRLSAKGGDVPHPRASHSLNFISDSLVLFGGGCEGGRHLEDTWVAHAGDGRRVGRWRQTNLGMPPGRFGQSSIMAGDKLVLFGGINDHGVRHNDTWVGQFRDEGTPSSTRFVWTHLNAGPTAPLPRGAHAGCCMGTQSMVIHGGIGPDGQRLGDTWLLDLSGGSPTWREVVPIMSPPPRSGHTLTWIGGTLMVLFGGRGSGYEVLNDMWILDIGKRDPDWVQVNASSAVSKRLMPQPRVGHSATLVLGGRVLIYGGEDSQRRRKNDFWVLDPNVLPTVKSRSGDWMVKKMSGRIWKKLQVEGHPPDSRSFHRACTDRSGRFMYIFGGMVDRIAHPEESSGLRFDGRLYLAELLLNF